jgi:hypothetical protein
VLSGIQHAYKDVKVMQNTARAAEFLQKIVQVCAGLLDFEGTHCEYQGVTPWYSEGRSSGDAAAVRSHSLSVCKLRLQQHTRPNDPAVL